MSAGDERFQVRGAVQAAILQADGSAYIEILMARARVVPVEEGGMSIGLTMRAEDVRKLRPEPVPVVVKWPKPAAWFAWYGFGLGVVVGLALGHLLLPPL